jgi:hypothetical protein
MRSNDVPTPLYIDHDNQRLGIGTPTPGSVLDVQGTQGQLFSVTDDLSGEIFAVSDISGVPIMTVNSDGTSYFDGNVGIGTTSPGAKLEVAGTGDLSFKINNTQYNRSLIIEQGGGYSHLKASHVSGIAINYGQGNPGILSLFNNTTQAVKINTNGNSYLNGGNVGIETTSPVATFQVGSITATAMSQVVGKARIVGTNYIPSSTQMGTLDIASTTRNSSAPFNQGFGPSLTFSQNISGYVNGYEVVVGAIKSIVTSGSNTGQESAMTFLVNGGTSTGVIERMRIAEDGNVGIGTTNPQAPLVISNSSTDGLEFHNSISSNSRIISYKRSNNTFRPLRLEALTHIFGISGNEKMRIDSSGKVGIGISNPTGKLTVVSDNEYNSGGGLRLQSSSSADRTLLYFSTSQSNEVSTIQSYRDGTGNGVIPLLLNPQGGNVGINTTLPDFKLDVDGTFGVSDLPFNTDSVSVLVADETLGADTIINGDFATATDWTLGTGWSIANGKLTANNPTSYAQQGGVFASGVSNTYKISLTVSNYVSGYFTILTGGSTAESQQFSANGNYTITFNTNSPSSTTFHFTPFGSFNGSIENVSVKQVTSASNQIQKRELGTGAFGPTPVGAYLPLAGGTMTGGTNHGDSVYSYWGASNDLQIYHDGTDSYVSNTQNSGDLIIQNGGNDKDVIFKCDDGSGGTTPYITLDGSAGNIKVYKNMNFQDNDVLQMGTSGDLNIYHDGSNSYINETGTGSLYVGTNSFRLTNTAGTENLISAFANDTVILYNNNIEKLRTTGPGITVTGDIQIDSALLSNQKNTDVDTGTEAIASVVLATYTAAFFDFVIKKGTNVRSGTVYACHDGTNVEFTETSTNDLGDTSDVTLNVVISTIYLQLQATTTSDDWIIKSLIRAI